MQYRKPIILWEYDKPQTLPHIYNYDAGIWYYKMTPGVVTVTDDYTLTGYYTDNNILWYSVKSVKVDQVAQNRVTSLADCLSTNASFYYDFSTSYIYFHFDGFEPPLAKVIDVGISQGYMCGYKSDNTPVFNTFLYEPRISKIFNIKKSIDPMYFGIIKYSNGSIELDNGDGHFDDWRERNLFAQESRLLVGNDGDDYANYEANYTGFIENDERDFNKFTVDLADPRKLLTQPIIINTFSQDDYPYLDDSDDGAPIPIAYGLVYDVKPVCINRTQSTSTYTFKLCDTTYRYLSSIVEVRVKGTVVSESGTSTANGTFNLSDTQLTDADGNLLFDDVRVDFYATSTSYRNGVDIIKDLMYLWDDKNFISSFWDTAEVNAAELLSIDTGLYIDDASKKLNQAIESICNDTLARFFVKDNGLYTIRIYDANRTPSYTIYSYDWLDEPKISNTGTDYISSAVVKYRHRQEEDEYSSYTNNTYKNTAFATYKKYKDETFETNIPSKTDAIDISEIIISKLYNVKDIIERTVNWNFSGIEVTDFIIASPHTRYGEPEEWGIYEVLSTDKNPIFGEIKLSLQYVKATTNTIINYYVLVDESGNYVSDDTINVIGNG